MKENLNFKELMQAFIDGKKVRKSCWPSDDYFYLKNNRFLDENNYELDSLIIYKKDDDWELYDEIKMNDVFWALEQIKKGFKVKKYCWGCDRYLILKNDSIVNENGAYVSLVLKEVLDKEWILAE